MTSSVSDKLSNERIRQLLMAVGARSQEDTSADIDAPEYNWHQCQYFTIEQCGLLADLSEQLGAQCDQVFGRLFNGQYEVMISSAGQDYAAEVFSTQAASNDYAIGFSPAGSDSFGLISIPRKTALTWTAQLLGGGESEEQNQRDLSALEESLLQDIIAGMTEAFSAIYNSPVESSGQICCGKLPVEWAEGDPIYKITIGARRPSDAIAHYASFVIQASQLNAIVGKTDTEKKPTISPEQAQSILMEHIYDIPVAIRAELGTVKVDFGAIMGLEVNDVLVLEKKITDPISLLLNGKTFRSGRIAQSEGHYAVSIL